MTISQPIRIHGDRISGNCQKVAYVARHVGVAFQWIDVDVMKAETRTPAFLKLNPAGQVPVVELPDGRTLAQSNAILTWLGEGSDLIPADPFIRAKMFEWLFWEQYSHEPTVAVARFRHHYQRIPVADIDPALMNKGNDALDLMDRHLAAMARNLSTQAFFTGAAPSLADFALYPYTRMSDQGGFDVASRSALLRWLDAMAARFDLTQV